ncbi:MAG: UDP-N-acetylglucosamine 2-epimerase [Candidatus Aenigmatarchaeota archaeon]|nr:MAG: UDP-N-acetylglucosamine 2-epimerase [Candidatus Aenigmarchaeota archaeon]
MNKNKILVFANINDFIFFPKESLLFEIYKKFNKIYFSFFVVPFIRKLRKNNEVVVVCADNETKNFMENKGIEPKILFDYSIRDKIEEVNDNVISIIDNSRFCKTIKEITKHGNTSLFDLAELGVYSYLITSIGNYEMFNSAVKMEKPDKIVSINRNGVYGTIALLASEDNGIELLYHDFMLMPKIKTKFLDFIFPHMVNFLRKRTRTKPVEKLQSEYPKDKKTNKILVFTGSTHHVGMIVPWAEELQKNPKNHVVVIGLFDNKKDYVKHNIEFELFGNYMTDEIFRKLNEQSGVLKKKWDNLREDMDFKKSVTYKNKNTWKMMKNELTSLFLGVFPKVLEYFKISCNIMESMKPDVVMVLNDRNKFGKSAVMAGKIKNKKTFWLQHGAIGKYVRGPSIADNNLVFGNHDKKFLIQRGINDKNIFVTGQPRFDSVVAKKIDKKSVYKQLGIDPEKGIVVFTTQLDLPDQELVISEIVRAMKEFPNLRLVIKLHPLDLPHLPHNIVKKYDSDAVIVKNIDIHELLKSCEIMITETSTTSLDATMLNKPVIIMNLGNQHEDTIYEKEGCGIGVHSEGELKSAIKRILHDKKTKNYFEKNRKKIIYDLMYRLDGKASKRIRKLVEKMAK